MTQAVVFIVVVLYVMWLHFDGWRRAVAVKSAITDLERLNEVLSAGIADQVRVREIIQKLRKAVE